jgi:hypothetical protein
VTSGQEAKRRGVFLNISFDEDYEPLFVAMIFACAGRFLAGFFVPPIYHPDRPGKKSFFKVAHYRPLCRIDGRVGRGVGFVIG